MRSNEDTKRLKLVILTYESLQANLMTERLLTAFPGQVQGIVTSEVIVPGKNTVQSLVFLLKRTGLGFVARKGLEILMGRAATALLKVAGRSPRVPAVGELGRRHDVPVYGSKDVNDPETLRVVATWRPDLVISVYLNQLIRAPLLALSRGGTINVHPAILPHNRGLFPYFWALANGDEETGVSVHWVEPRFDTGDILLQDRLPITVDDTVMTLAHKSAELGAVLLERAVDLVQSGDAPRVAQDPARASYHSWPTAADVRRFSRRGRKYGSMTTLWRDLTR